MCGLTISFPQLSTDLDLRNRPFMSLIALDNRFSGHRSSARAKDCTKPKNSSHIRSRVLDFIVGRRNERKPSFRRLQDGEPDGNQKAPIKPADILVPTLGTAPGTSPNTRCCPFADGQIADRLGEEEMESFPGPLAYLFDLSMAEETRSVGHIQSRIAEPTCIGQQTTTWVWSVNMGDRPAGD
jgi:hypothetical protein